MKRKDTVEQTKDLIHDLVDIARCADPAALVTPKVVKHLPGPNRWADVTPEDFGKCFDFRILDGDVFMPTSVAAQEWLRSKCTEDQHWYSCLDGFFGIAVTRLDEIQAAASRDGLISESDYVENMSENDALARQQEDV